MLVRLIEQTSKITSWPRRLSDIDLFLSKQGKLYVGTTHFSLNAPHVCQNKQYDEIKPN